MQIIETKHPYARISVIAARLGVPPDDGSAMATVLVEGADGKRFDLFKVIEAFMDRMDQVSKLAAAAEGAGAPDASTDFTRP